MKIFSKKFDAKTAFEKLDERMERRKTRDQKASPVLESYLKVASLAQSFDPAGKMNADKDSPISAEVLLNQSRVVGGAGAIWQLKESAREWGLSLIQDAAEALQMLQQNPNLFNQANLAAMQQYLQGKRDALAQQTLPELRASLYAVSRLSKITKPPTLPSVEAISSRIQALQTYSSLEKLTAGGVVGREDDLDELRRYVGVVEAKSWLSLNVGTATRAVRGLFTGDKQPPLLMFGPGGIGKSTILAQFINEHARAAGSVRFPFCYLDFERPSLSPRDPFSLFREIVRQLHFQYPNDCPEQFGMLENYLREEQQRRRKEERQQSGTSSTSRMTIQREIEHSRFEQAGRLVSTLSQLIQQLISLDPNRDSAADSTIIFKSEIVMKNAEQEVLLRDNLEVAELPFLIVMDSFEEAQQRSIDAIEQLWDLFKQLQEGFPKLRVVVSGRAPVHIPWNEDDKPDNMEIKGLKPRHCIELMVLRGMPEDISTLISEKLSGNPLTLRLAVSLFKKRRSKDPKAKWLKELKTGGWWRLFDDADAFIQGQLYHRILEHVATKDARKLAHPGLVLRRITPGIIQYVLAEPCGLGSIDEERAKELFDELAMEVDLVERRGAAEVLYHRADVRQVMLTLMEKDKSKVISKIERRAVDFYQDETDPESRAEEIYHRLRLGEHPRGVAERWLPEVETYLDDALPEVPVKAQAFLASKLRGLLELDEEVFQQADLADWERLISNRASYLVDEGRWREASKLMNERKDRSPDSPLLSLEARALIAEGKTRAAKTIIEKGLSATAEQGDQTVRLDLMEVAADLASSRKDLQSAYDFLLAASRLIRGMGAPHRRAVILLCMIELTKQDGVSVAERVSHEQELKELLLEIDETLFQGQDALVEQLARAVGRLDAGVLCKLLRVHSPPKWQKDEAMRLAEELCALAKENPTLKQNFQKLAYSAGYHIDRDDVSNVTEVLNEMIAGERFSGFLQELVRLDQWDENLRQTVIDHYFKARDENGRS